MRLLKWNAGDVCLIEVTEKHPPPYAILSHTWGRQNTEVTFHDMEGKDAKIKPGYAKIQFCGEQAARDGLEYFWIDTCCINKSDSVELLESLNSMFKWYQDSTVCYVYLSDVSQSEQKPGPGLTGPLWEPAFRNSKWFTRGWTLQELLAPDKVVFYSRESEHLGDKKSLEHLIHDITKIPLKALQDGRCLSKLTTQDRCAWMDGRETTKPEDKAYALLGIVDAYLPFMYGHGRDKAMITLFKAIEEREEGRLSIIDADYYLRSHYYSDERLCINRLSGAKLDMKKCYINLAIVTQQLEKKVESSEDETSTFGIFHQLKVERPALENQIALSKLFDSRGNPEGLTKVPRRFLIQGRAGVGKTTLCKKMVFEFERHNLWRGLFDRVLWVPLRSLKTWTGDGFSMKEFFYYHYFRDHRYGTRLAKCMEEEVNLGNQPGTSNRILFILDGLDEVSEAWNPDEAKYDFLCKLLNQPNVIITCRPHARVLRNFGPPIDLELETIGFYPDQVNEYLEMAIQTPAEIRRVQDFLKRFHIIQGLVRIPILLDSLCYIWNDSGDNNPALQSMTKFYKYIKEKLLMKDSVGLEREKERIASTSNVLELEKTFKSELALLERLAFTGMVNDIIDFEPKTRHAVLNAFKHEGILPDQSVRHLSFLRTSDPHKEGADVNYHFLHLTFQEFFAACYFMRQWISDSDKSIYYLDLKNGNRMKTESTLGFLAQHKYDPRYDIFWRFVAGLLDDESDSKEITNFFQAIDQQPLDLLGPAHQRLIMHCLNEISPGMGQRQDLERRLKVWMVFEFKFTGTIFLGREMEFPEQILLDALQEKDRGGVDSLEVLKALRLRRNLSYKAQQALLAQLDDQDSSVRGHAADALSSQAGEPQVREALLARLDDQASSVQESAADALSSQAGEPQVQEALLARLDDQDSSVRGHAADALSSQAGEPHVQEALLARLDDQAFFVQWSAANALSSQAGEPHVQEALLAQLDDQDSSVRRHTANVLSSQAGEPQVREALLFQLDDQDSSVRMSAADVLSSQAGKPQVQEALLFQLDDQDSSVRWHAADALSSQAGEPQVREALLARLDDQDSSVRWHTANVLSSQAGEPQVREALLARLDDQDSSVRGPAANALSSQAGEPQVREALLARLDDQDSSVRWSTTYALSSQAGEPQVQEALLARLDDQASFVRYSAAYALSSQAGKPQVREALLARLDDQDSSVQWSAAKALSSRASEPQVREALLALLSDQSLPNSIRQNILETILKYEDNHLEMLNTKHKRLILRALIETSIKQQLSWQVGSDTSWFYTPWGLVKTDITDEKKLVKLVKRARPDGYPADDSQKPNKGLTSRLRKLRWGALS